MIITINTEEIAKRMIEDGKWTIDHFADNETPTGWTNELVDLVPEYEGAVHKDVIDALESNALDRKGAKAEIVRRFIRNETHADNPLADSLEWFEKQTIITTRKAFELARKDRTVIQLFADGTDSQLEDLELEDEYFPDKTKSWPHIATIFVTERP